MGLPTPNTRKEQYLNAIATGNAGGLPTPITREEEYLDAIAKSGGGSGDGDMKKSVYDSDLAVAGAGGIKGFVNSAVAGKVDKVAGKGLSTNDYDNTEKEQNEANAEAIEAIVNVNGVCNILPYIVQSTASATVIFTVNNDGSVTVNGTPTSSYPYITYHTDFTLKAGTYVIDSGVPAQSSVYVNLKDSGGNTIANTYDGKKEFTLATDTVVVAYIYLHSMESVSNFTIYPMLYDARLKPTGYVPYAMTNRELTEKVSHIVGLGTIQEWNGDLNDFRSGMFKVNDPALASNLPNTTNIGWIVFSNVAADSVSTFGFQIAIGYNSGETYIRRLWADWSSWYRLDT